jgi:hypothetical protein
MLLIKRASAIKLNSTVALTLILLILMLGAGYVSAIWGFAVGVEALQGVNQPDARLKSKIKLRKHKSQEQAAVVMLKEEDIITNVRARIEGKGKNVKPEKSQPQNQQSSKQTSPQNTQVAAEIPQSGFPIINKNQGVTLELLSARFSGGALQLKVNFKNEGDRTVRFLSSFLDVTDDQGRALSVNTEGLPGELPPNGKMFSGTVSISTALLEDVKKLSMTLTDYPEQQLRLQMLNIPVQR